MTSSPATSQKDSVNGVHKTVYPELVKYVDRIENGESHCSYLEINVGNCISKFLTSHSVRLCDLFLRRKIFISGGFLAMLITNETQNFDNEQLKSDIDIYVLGNTAEEKCETVNTLISILLTSNRASVIGWNKSVIYLMTSGVKQIIQLIIMDSKYNSAKLVIDEFDMDYVASYYNGRSVFVSKRAALALVNKKTNYIPTTTNLSRVLYRGYKAVLRGYTISLDSSKAVSLSNIDSVAGGDSIVYYDEKYGYKFINPETVWIRDTLEQFDVCRNYNEYKYLTFDELVEKLTEDELLKYYKEQYNIPYIELGYKLPDYVYSPDTEPAPEHIYWNGLSKTSYYNNIAGLPGTNHVAGLPGANPVAGLPVAPGTQEDDAPPTLPHLNISKFALQVPLQRDTDNMLYKNIKYKSFLNLSGYIYSINKKHVNGQDTCVIRLFLDEKSRTYINDLTELCLQYCKLTDIIGKILELPYKNIDYKNWYYDEMTYIINIECNMTIIDFVKLYNPHIDTTYTFNIITYFTMHLYGSPTLINKYIMTDTQKYLYPGAPALIRENMYINMSFTDAIQVKEANTDDFKIYDLTGTICTLDTLDGNHNTDLELEVYCKNKLFRPIPAPADEETFESWRVNNMVPYYGYFMALTNAINKSTNTYKKTMQPLASDIHKHFITQVSKDNIAFVIEFKSAPQLAVYSTVNENIRQHLHNIYVNNGFADNLESLEEYSKLFPGFSEYNTAIHGLVGELTDESYKNYMSLVSNLNIKGFGTTMYNQLYNHYNFIGTKTSNQQVFLKITSGILYRWLAGDKYYCCLDKTATRFVVNLQTCPAFLHNDLKNRSEQELEKTNTMCPYILSGVHIPSLNLGQSFVEFPKLEAIQNKLVSMILSELNLYTLNSMKTDYTYLTDNTAFNTFINNPSITNDYVYYVLKYIVMKLKMNVEPVNFVLQIELELEPNVKEPPKQILKKIVFNIIPNRPIRNIRNNLNTYNLQYNISKYVKINFKSHMDYDKYSRTALPFLDNKPDINYHFEFYSYMVADMLPDLPVELIEIITSYYFSKDKISLLVESSVIPGFVKDS